MIESLFTDREALAAICRRHQIRRLSLFGSMLDGTSRADSDVDLLVEFDPDAKPSLLTMADIELQLSELLGGRRVDLRTARDLSRYFRDEIVRTARVQYEAA
jgi:hypothetical protein